MLLLGAVGIHKTAGPEQKSALLSFKVVLFAIGSIIGNIGKLGETIMVLCKSLPAWMTPRFVHARDWPELHAAGWDISFSGASAPWWSL